MADHKHSELESEIRSLEKMIDDLDYDLRQLKQELQARISEKADSDHFHLE